MAEISHDDLKQEIHAVLKTADLNVMSAKKIREQVEKKLNCSLLPRKKECDDIVMDYMNEQEAEEEKKRNEDKNDSDGDGGADGNGNDDQSEEESESEEVDSEPETKKRKSKSNSNKKKKTPAKAPAAKKRTSSAKKKKWSSNASDSDSTSDDDDSDYEQPKAKKAKKKAGGGGGGGDTGGGGAKRQTGFTRALKLSPDLAALVGADSMSRHEVVKKVWGIIKERQLADPNNKQFTICDDQLYTVMKVKRFRTFGMLKHLKPHFID